MISVNHDNLFSYCNLIPINISVIYQCQYTCVNVIKSLTYVCVIMVCVCVQPGSLCPVKPGPLRPREVVSGSTDPSQVSHHPA
jgi:hypothetical protein